MTLKRASFALDSITKKIFRSSKAQIFCIQGVEYVHCACLNEQSKLCKTEKMIVHLEGMVMRLYNLLIGFASFLLLIKSVQNLEKGVSRGRSSWHQSV